MPQLEILTYPNPLLRQPGTLIVPEQLESEGVQQLIHNMMETMYAFPGTVGLAAPQVGASLQILVMDATAKTDRSLFKVMINPVLLAQSQWKYSREGCLSFPDYLVTVKRARKLTVSYLNPKGDQIIQDLRDFEAIICQHEIDHLNGILFLDRVQNIQTDLIRREVTEAIERPPHV